MKVMNVLEGPPVSIHPTGHVPENLEIVLAEVEHLDAVAMLLDRYRMFRGQVSNLPAVRHFLFERMLNHESVIFLAQDKISGQAFGFLQLFPTFSSLALDAVWILSELFVMPEVRGQGVASKLTLEAIDLVRKRQDRGLLLEIPPDNQEARELFESLGFAPDEAALHYVYRVQAS
jgi:ribosomal protein S18 acetylase RimI-like enzyme